MIKVDGLSKWYGRKLAVDDISFELDRGEVLAFIGPNGAGKSTTMRVITGFIPADRGKVAIGGHDMDSKPLAAKALLGYLPENAPLYANMTVSAFLRFVAEARGFSGKERGKRVDNVIEACFLEPVRHQTIDTLSKGYRHRCCFAQAIIHDPEALILDEPTDGLDPNQKREVRELIKRMGENKAIILSTHILEEVEAVASRVVMIDRGRKVFDGTPAELKARSEVADTYVLRFHSGTEEGVRAMLGKIAGVQKAVTFDVTENSLRARVFHQPDIDRAKFRQDLFAGVKDSGLDVGELALETGRLDEVFYQITHSDQEVG